MTHVLIPRSKTSSAKKVASTDFEKYEDYVTDAVICGFTVSAQCPAALAADICTGKARIKGLYIENTVADCVGCLTACSCNYIFATICRDMCCAPCSWSYSTNTTGCTPADSLFLAKAKTNCSTITCVCQNPTATQIVLNSGCCVPIHYPACALWLDESLNNILKNNGTEKCPSWIGTGGGLGKTICCPDLVIIYSNTTAFICGVPVYGDISGCVDVWKKFSDDTTVAIGKQLLVCDSFCSYGTQCAADCAWPSNDVCVVRVDITNDYIDFCIADLGCSCSDNISHDMTGICCVGISNTKWVTRFKWDIVGCPPVNCGCDTVRTRVGLSCKPSCGTFGSSHDFIGFGATWTKCSGCNQYVAASINAATLNGGVDHTFMCVSPSMCQTLYVEIKRKNSCNYTVEVFSDACYSCSIEASGCLCVEGGSANQNLRYFLQAQGGAGITGANGALHFRIDCVKVKSGVCCWNSI